MYCGSEISEENRCSADRINGAKRAWPIGITVSKWVLYDKT